MLTKPRTSSSVIPNMGLQKSAQRHRHKIWFVCITLIGAVVLLIGWQGLVPTPIAHGVMLQSPQRADNFKLTDHTGKSVSLNDFRGKYVLLNFGYTFCPDVCPITLATLSSTIEQLGNRSDNVQVLFVSVDPKRDSIEQLSKYITYFHPSFIALTGSENEIRATATQFGIYFSETTSEIEADADAYLVDHTSTVLMIDPDGYLRVIFPYGTTAEALASDMSTLMKDGLLQKFIQF